jgi:IPT/TIG domain
MRDRLGRSLRVAGSGGVIATVAAMVLAATLAAPDVPVATASADGTRVLYVAPGGSDAGNSCAVASSPCATISHAVAEASANDVIDVAAGRYLEHAIVVAVSVTIEGAGAASTIIDADHQGQAMLVPSGATVALDGVTVANGRTSGHAGAVENSGTLSLVHDRFVGNTATDPGGAIVNYAAITAMDGDQFNSNRSAAYGGAVENFGTIGLATGDSFTGNIAEYGAGAVDNQGTITSLDDSSFTTNDAEYAGALDNSGSIGDLSRDTFWRNGTDGYGGAIVNVLAARISTLTDDTFAGNSVSSRLGLGGAIEQDSATIGLLANDTIIGNHATIGGGIDNEDSSIVQSMTGVIVALNTGTQGMNCEDFQSKIVDSGYNLESDTAATCGFSARSHDLVGANPGLRRLGDYGGPTLTAPPSPSSILLTTSPSLPCVVGIDQRGVPRPQPVGGLCDIGAVQFAPPAAASLSPPAGPRSGDTHVHIVGSGFTLSTQVTFAGTPAKFWVTSDSTITALSPPGRGSEPVRVVNPDGRSANALRFTYR